MKLWRRFLGWWNDPQRTQQRRARRDLEILFSKRTHLLHATSLKPQHKQRVQVLQVLTDPYRVVFGLVRHPRPYSFSKQVHHVLEVWSYQVDSGKLERMKGRNLTRESGQDGEPSGEGI